MRHEFNLFFLSHLVYAALLVPVDTLVYANLWQGKEMKQQFNLFFLSHQAYATFLFQYKHLCRLIPGKARR